MSKEDGKSKLDNWADEFGTPVEPKKPIAQDPLRPVKEYDDRRYQPGRKTRMSYVDTKRQEESMIEAIDDLRAMKRLAPTVMKLLKKKIPLDQAIKETSSETFLMLMKMAFTEGNPKVKSNVLMHMLSLAGYSATQKNQIERVDSDTPREALLSMIAGAKDDLSKEGIEVVDNRTLSSEQTHLDVEISDDDDDESYET